jgi:hypothetical protein
MLNALSDPDFSERTSNEVARSDEAAMSTAPVLPATPTFPDLTTSNAISGMDQVAQLMGKESEAPLLAKGFPSRADDSARPFTG